MGAGRNWTVEEKQRFIEEWGLYSLPTMAKRFNRSIDALKIKQQRWGLPDLCHASDLITLNELIQEFGLNYGYDVPRLKKMGLPIRYKLVINERVAMVDIEKFWIFAEQHPHFFDFSRVREYTFGAEPEWVKEKRRADHERARMIKPHNMPWSGDEDNLLRVLVKQQRYSYTDLVKRLHRSEGAIARRLRDLKIAGRPVKADNHTKWTDEEYNLLAEGIRLGHNYEVMSGYIGKSSKAIRGRVYSVYLTESLDKARKLIGNGGWGENRPERKLRHKNVMDREEREAMSEDLSRLTGLLVLRMKQLSEAGEGYEEYWQKDMCRHWDDVDGCTKCQSDCDSCEHFERIEPQNCKRCGATFFEREKSIYCPRCIEDRYRQHKKKVAYMLSHNKW